MNKLDLKLTSKVIESNVRPIKASWTRTMIKDLEIQSGLDMDNLLKSELRKTLRKEKINKIFN